MQFEAPGLFRRHQRDDLPVAERLCPFQQVREDHPSGRVVAHCADYGRVRTRPGRRDSSIEGGAAGDYGDAGVVTRARGCDVDEELADRNEANRLHEGEVTRGGTRTGG